MSVNSIRTSRRELTEVFNCRIKCSSLPMKWYKALVNYIIFFNCWIPIGNAMTLATENQISVALFPLFLMNIDIVNIIILLKVREEMKRFHLSALKYLAAYGCVQVVILLINIFLSEVDIMFGIGESIPYAIFLYMNFIYFKKRAYLLSDGTNDISLSEIKYYVQDGGLGLEEELDIIFNAYSYFQSILMAKLSSVENEISNNTKLFNKINHSEIINMYTALISASFTALGEITTADISKNGLAKIGKVELIDCLRAYSLLCQKNIELYSNFSKQADGGKYPVFAFMRDQKEKRNLERNLQSKVNQCNLFLQSIVNFMQDK